MMPTQTLIALVERKIHAPHLRMVDGKWSCSFLFREDSGAMTPFVVQGFATKENAFHCARGMWREREKDYGRFQFSRRLRSITLA